MTTDYRVQAPAPGIHIDAQELELVLTALKRAADDAANEAAHLDEKAETHATLNQLVENMNALRRTLQERARRRRNAGWRNVGRRGEWLD